MANLEYRAVFFCTAAWFLSVLITIIACAIKLWEAVDSLLAFGLYSLFLSLIALPTIMMMGAIFYNWFFEEKEWPTKQRRS